MSDSLVITFGVLAATVVGFLSDRIRLEAVAMLALLALALSGVLSPEEALAGFSDSVVLTLAGLFVVGGALFKTGVANRLGDLLAYHGGTSQTKLLVTIMVGAALLSGFMSSTGTAAILIPAVMGVARRTGLSHSKLLMPLACGCLIGGMLTLIGTPPNLVVQGALTSAGLTTFGFFSFTPMGLLCLVLSIGYMVVVGVQLLPSNEEPKAAKLTIASEELAGEYDLRHHLFRVRLEIDSALVGKTPADCQARSRFGVNILGRQIRGQDQILKVEANTVLEAGDVLHVHAQRQDAKQFATHFQVKLGHPLADYKKVAPDEGLAELLLYPRSRLLGATLRSSRFEQRFKVKVVSLARMGKLVEENLAGTRLRFGDTLLVTGHLRDLALLTEEVGNFVVVGLPDEVEAASLRLERAPVAIALLVVMMFLMSLKLLPTVIAVMAVAVAALLTGCLDAEDAYRSISWESIVLIAGMLPIATALDKTGGVELIANQLIATLGQFGPTAIMAGLFIVTSIFSQFVSNTATTVLLAPIAIQAGQQVGVGPQAFLMAVAVAASAAFVTPVASPVNTLVLSPGGYRFADFVKVGLPLQLLVMVACLVTLPYLFPFTG